MNAQLQAVEGTLRASFRLEYDSTDRNLICMRTNIELSHEWSVHHFVDGWANHMKFVRQNAVEVELDRALLEDVAVNIMDTYVELMGFVARCPHDEIRIGQFLLLRRVAPGSVYLIGPVTGDVRDGGGIPLSMASLAQLTRWTSLMRKLFSTPLEKL